MATTEHDAEGRREHGEAEQAGGQPQGREVSTSPRVETSGALTLSRSQP